MVADGRHKLPPDPSGAVLTTQGLSTPGPFSNSRIVLALLPFHSAAQRTVGAQSLLQEGPSLHHGLSFQWINQNRASLCSCCSCRTGVLGFQPCTLYPRSSA